MTTTNRGAARKVPGGESDRSDFGSREEHPEPPSTGFENWNRGFDAWKAWGDILYTNDSIYHVHGVKMTLAQYQKSMDMMLKAADIQMGAFHNMLIRDDWAAIHYAASTKDLSSGNEDGHDVMTFLHFVKDGDSVRGDKAWSR